MIQARKLTIIRVYHVDRKPQRSKILGEPVIIPGPGVFEIEGATVGRANNSLDNQLLELTEKSICKEKNIPKSFGIPTLLNQ